MSEMKELAQAIKKDHQSKIDENNSNTQSEEVMDKDSEISEFEKVEDESVVEEEGNAFVTPEEDEDDDAVVIGDDGVSDFPNDEDNSSEDLNDFDFANDDFEITDEMIKEQMPDIPEEEARKFYSEIREEAMSHRQTLMLRNGLPMDDANTLAITKMNKLADAENIRYLKEHPNSVTVTVNKQDVNKLEFTKEEREKMAKSKVINLQVIEDQSVLEAKIKRVDKKKKAAYLQKLDTNLSHYSVPLPLMDDYVQFRGSQIIQLIQAVRYDDTTYDEMVSKKAALVFDRLVGGSHLKKTDENGRPSMSFVDFTNKFLFHDLDMALYGILVASSMEEIETNLTCNDCGHTFGWKYNIKSLLDMEDLTDEFKDKFETILEHKSDATFLTELYEKEKETKVVQSPLTGNVYHINHPTIARVIALYAHINQEDETMLYLSSVAMFLDQLLVKDNSSDEFIPIEDDEHVLLMDVLQDLPQEEIELLLKFIRPMIYTPRFILKSKCEKCGQKMRNELSVDDLVFLRARDSSTEIR